MRVNLFGDVGRYRPKSDQPFVDDLPDGARVRDLLDKLGIELKGEQLTVGVNGELGGLDTALCDGDRVMLVTPMEGG